MKFIVAKAAISQGDGCFPFDPIDVYPSKGIDVRVKNMAAGKCHTDQEALSTGKPFIINHDEPGVRVQQLYEPVKPTNPLSNSRWTLVDRYYGQIAKGVVVF